MFSPSRDVTNARNNWDSVVRLIAKLPTIVAAFHRLRHGDEAIARRDDLGHAANFYYMLTEHEPSPAAAKVLDACLILHAEHTMNASTFSARVTGSTLANPYTVVSAAVGTLTGPLHGGANEEALDMLEEIGSVENVRPWLENAVATKKKIMGFGHRVYKVKDPRATVLQELAENVFAESGRPAKYEMATALGKVANTILGPKGIYPNVDFYSGIVCESLGIPRRLFAPIFAVARVAADARLTRRSHRGKGRRVAHCQEARLQQAVRNFLRRERRRDIGGRRRGIAQRGDHARRAEADHRARVRCQPGAHVGQPLTQ